MLDVFKSDAFGVVALTDAIRELKYRPGRLGQLGLFSTTSISTTSIALERVGDIVQLVKPKPRGAAGDPRDQPKRSITDLSVPHFPRPWAVLADRVQNVRAFGSENQMQTVQQVVLEEMASCAMDFDMTEEAARLGAIQGIVTYADASTLNLFTTFGVTEETEVDFDLDAATPADGILRKRCTAVIRAMRKRLGGVNFGSIHAFVGDNFFDDLLQHKEVRDTYKGYSEAAILRDSYVGPNRGDNPIFQFGGIVFENYGQVDVAEGDASFVGITTNKARFFPLGVPNLFRTYYAPANYNETVNTLGQRLYAKQKPMDYDKGIEGEMQMNALQICTRPGALMGARRT